MNTYKEESLVKGLRGSVWSIFTIKTKVNIS